MRLLVALLVLVAGCKFQPPAATDASPGDDDDAAIDAAIDAPDGGPGDQDGDGVPDTTDNCPGTANPLQRDHDSDVIGDECDRCPHLKNPADPDGDGDGVGDACDPRPGNMGDTFAKFVGFYEEDATTVAGWTQLGTWVVTNGWLSVTSNGNPDYVVVPPDTARAMTETSMRLDSFTSNDVAGLVNSSVGDPANPSQYYECVVRDLGGGNGVQAEASALYPGSGGVDTSAAGFDVADGRTVRIRNNLDTNFRCTLSSAPLTVGPSGNKGATGGQTVLGSAGAQVSFDYVFVVEIGNL